LCAYLASDLHQAQNSGTNTTYGTNMQGIKQTFVGQIWTKYRHYSVKGGYKLLMQFKRLNQYSTNCRDRATELTIRTLCG